MRTVIDTTIDTVVLCLYIGLIPFLPLVWLFCRATAEQCPKCGSKWATELVGEYDGEMWHCHNCKCDWDVIFNIPK